MSQIYQQFKQEIMADPENAGYTEQGIEPLFSAPQAARIAIVGQAPGIKAQTTKKYWNDQSGKRLRKWLNVSDEQFYESDIFTVLPMDFYYPGKGKSGDLPPRKGFAAKWHPPIIDALPDIELFVLVGSYAQNYYLSHTKKRNLTETVKSYQEYLPTYFPIIHPSPLNIGWLKKNPWFEKQVVPDLQKMVKEIISGMES